MSKIEKIHARQILDSRGNPTVEVEVTTNNKIVSRASIPSGASTGKHEALELRDNNIHIYNGKGVTKALDNINSIIAPKLIGLSVFDQKQIDQIMIDLDGTKDKSNLGANAILGVSIAVAKAGAASKNMPLFKYLATGNVTRLPMPLVNVINGGCHADNSLDIQEFMIVPVGAICFSQALQMSCEIFHNLAKVLKQRGLATNVGDEGGYAPNLKSNKEAIELILQAIEKSNYKAGSQVAIAIDAASSEFYDNETKTYKLQNSGKNLTSVEMVEFWKQLINEYPIISLEDPMSEDDWSGWSNLTKEIGYKVQIVGDDLFTTNIERLQRGIENKSANSILVKMNQIGTISETIQTTQMAIENGFSTVISHRSGETEDTTIADLSVALNTAQIKTGSMSRSDRTAKYNQLLRIEEQLGKYSVFENPLAKRKKVNT